jgi:single-strand DNA-binding protein
MAGISKITIIGTLGRDPDTRYTPQGRMNVQFSVAVNSKRGGETVNWFRITAWGRLAETLDALSQQGHLTKGKQVYIDGTFEAREYQTQGGETRTSLDVNATTVQLIGPRDIAADNNMAESATDVPF